MNKDTITIPRSIRYLGQWADFHLSNFPSKCIINKVIPGCGFTRFCIETPWENVILCSPRKMLLQNKYEQHQNLVYLVKNDLMDSDPGIDMDITKERKVIDQDSDNPDKLELTSVKSRLHTELREYLGSHLQHKILVTYDSFRVLKEVLEEMGIFQNFHVVVDEFQAIMQDARFKSSTEINFLYHLQNSHSAIFVSATPMLEKYLDELDEFRNLPYYELDWRKEDPSRVIKPDLDVKRMDSLSRVSKKIIDRFKSGDYAKATVMKNGLPVLVESKELVFYMNSVSAIARVIKSNGLKDSEVNILCSNTDQNQKKLWERLMTPKERRDTPEDQRPYQIGRVPLLGESRKPFTFCTRTVYLGADFYSDCASSYIFSDSNSDFLSVDISQDLPQILGRQRCEENPWKNSATFYYKTTSDCNKMSQDDFNEIIKLKKAKTASVIETWNTGNSIKRDALIELCFDSILVSHYKNNYVALNRVQYQNKSGEIEYIQVPVVNHLVRVSEERAFEIQQYDYADRFSVFATLSEELEYSNVRETEEMVSMFFGEYDKLQRISEKLQLLCEIDVSEDLRAIFLAQLPDTDKVKYFYQALGPERCKANSYAPKRMAKELGEKYFSKKELSDAIYKEFSVSEKILVPDVKIRLKKVFDGLGYTKTPKATDLLGYFDVREFQYNDPVTKKRTRSYELLRRLNL